MLKVELHAHTRDDPEDVIRHSAEELVGRAAALGYGALAITLHNRYHADAELERRARTLGLTLIPAIERTIEGCHLLLINYPPDCAAVASFDEVAALKRRRPEGLVIVPHPFFPLGHSIGGARLERHADLWDAVEVNAFYTFTVDFNRAARRWARARRIPLVGNGDVHQIEQLGSTWSLVDVEAPATAGAICDAIRAGRVRVASRPLSHVAAARIVTRALLAGLSRRAREAGGAGRGRRSNGRSQP
jgi:predicted metal-dependent phosphoesterase TrpH